MGIMTAEEIAQFEYYSLESRWFYFDLLVPSFIDDFFKNIKHESRTDVYLMDQLRQVPPITNKGIKLREGGYEIKSLLKEYLDSSIPGKVQSWKKTRSTIPNDIDLDESWQKVFKTRQMIRYEIRSETITEAVSYFPSQGCNVELTKFGSPFEKYWTFGFEAYGNDVDLHNNLRKIFKHISIQIKGIDGVLQIENSKSYPEWLAEL